MIDPLALAEEAEQQNWRLNLRKMHEVPREQRNLVRGRNPPAHGCAVQPRVSAWRHRGWGPGRHVLWDVKYISHPSMVSEQLRVKPLSAPLRAPRSLPGRRAEAGRAGMHGRDAGLASGAAVGAQREPSVL